ncbi:MAG TPA: LssY C-terminal domain-containing protein [Gemmataceae bacterium]|nr:LssY C-terminal domain-containing protein [Gemmataceae bacterium]
MNPITNPQMPFPSHYSFYRKVLGITIGGLIVYLLIAYLVMPGVWARRASRHPALEDAPRITQTKSGIPGDPLNVGLVASDMELVKALAAADWHPADLITLKSCVHITASTLFHRPYEEAPVSDLYVWGRKQDLAFQQSVGHDPRKRHHVRFWRSESLDDKGRPLWIGGATYDAKVGFSRTTFQVTHRIAPDVDTERDKLIQDLQKKGFLKDMYWVEGFHVNLRGKNGGGHPYHTDGKLAVGVIAPAGE